jgi:hypothetical protein
MVPILFDPFSVFLRQIVLPQKRVQISIYCIDLLLMPRMKIHLDITANRRMSKHGFARAAPAIAQRVVQSILKKTEYLTSICLRRNT